MRELLDSICSNINSNHQIQIIAAINYNENNIVEANNQLLSLYRKTDQENYIQYANLACIQYQMHNYIKAKKLFQDAIAIDKTSNLKLIHNMALTCFRLKKYEESLSFLSQITNKFEDFVKQKENKPDEIYLFIKINEIDETYNLQSAIYYERHQIRESMKVLNSFVEICKKVGYEVKPNINHNLAILNSSQDYEKSIETLESLLNTPDKIEETIKNLTSLYLANSCYEKLINFLDSNTSLIHQALSRHEENLIKAFALEYKSKEEALSTYDLIMNTLISKLEGSNISKSTINSSPSNLEKNLNEEKLKLLQTAICKSRIYWNESKFIEAEQVLLKVKNYCDNFDYYNQTMGHILFFQENRINDSVMCYEKIIGEHSFHLQEVDPFVIAYLYCGYYLQNNHNASEQLMKALREQMSSIDDQYELNEILIIIGSVFCSMKKFNIGLKMMVDALSQKNRKMIIENWNSFKKSIVFCLEYLQNDPEPDVDSNLLMKIIEFLDSIFKIESTENLNENQMKKFKTILEENNYLISVLKKLF